ARPGPAADRAGGPGDPVHADAGCGVPHPADRPVAASHHQGHRDAAERAEDPSADAGRRLPVDPGAEMRELSAILAIAYRDLLKFVRDPARIVFSLVFPVLFIGVLGGSLQSNLGAGAGYHLL